jgi:hypothetical protein
MVMGRREYTLLSGNKKYFYEVFFLDFLLIKLYNIGVRLMTDLMGFMFLMGKKGRREKFLLGIAQYTFHHPSLHLSSYLQ